MIVEHTVGSRWLSALLVLAALGCEPARSEPPATTDSSLSRYCDITAREGLTAWIRSTLTVCEGEASETTCHLARVSSDGTTADLAWSAAADLRIGFDVPGGYVLWGHSDRLWLVDESGAEITELAAWASDPMPSPDGSLVAFVGLAAGLEDWDRGAVTRVLVLDSQRLDVVLEIPDATASRPMPTPSGGAFYVSSASGTAAVWSAETGQPPRQLTNVGLSPVDIARITPTPGLRSLVLGEHLIYQSTSEDGAPSLWSVDVVSGGSGNLGEGGWPRPTPDGRVVARVRDTAEGCSAEYVPGGAP